MAALPVLIPSKGGLEIGIICEFFDLNRSINPLTAIPERYKEENFTFSAITTKHLITKHFVMMLLETDQSEVPILTTESKHEARDTQQSQANESVIDIIFTKLSALTLTSLYCKPL